MKETRKVGLPTSAVEFVESNLASAESKKICEIIPHVGYLGDSVGLIEFYLTDGRIVREQLEKVAYHDGYKVYTCLVSNEGETLFSWKEN